MLVGGMLVGGIRVGVLVGDIGVGVLVDVAIDVGVCVAVDVDVGVGVCVAVGTTTAADSVGLSTLVTATIVSLTADGVTAESAVGSGVVPKAARIPQANNNIATSPPTAQTQRGMGRFSSGFVCLIGGFGFFCAGSGSGWVAEAIGVVTIASSWGQLPFLFLWWVALLVLQIHVLLL